jgi:hypothetical protein
MGYLAVYSARSLTTTTATTTTIIIIIIIMVMIIPESNIPGNHKSTENSHTGHGTQTSGSANVKVQYSR